MGQDMTESDRVVAKTNPGTVKVNREQRTRYPVLRDSRIAVPNGVSCVPPTKNHYTKRNTKYGPQCLRLGHGHSRRA